jgi:hypothetical protein
MTLAEILRKLADTIDQNQAPMEPTPAMIVDVEPEGECDTELAQQPDDLMIPPLQLKMELLKKAVDVENVYAQEQREQDPEASNHKKTPMSPEEQQALAAMKKAAGVNALITHELADDEPLDS